MDSPLFLSYPALSPATLADKTDAIYRAVGDINAAFDDDDTIAITNILNDPAVTPEAAAQIFLPLDRRTWQLIAENAYGSWIPFSGVPDEARLSLLQAATAKLPGDKLAVVSEVFSRRGDIQRIADYLAAQDNSGDGVVQRKLGYLLSLFPDMAPPDRVRDTLTQLPVRRPNQEAVAACTVLTSLRGTPQFDEAIEAMDPRHLGYLVEAAIGASEFVLQGYASVSYDFARWTALEGAALDSANPATQARFAAVVGDVREGIRARHAALGIPMDGEVDGRLAGAASALAMSCCCAGLECEPGSNY